MSPRIRAWLGAGVVSSLALSSIGAQGQTRPDAEVGSGEEADVRAFGIISERNIFDPERRSASSRPVRREQAPPPRQEVIRLTGTMLHRSQAMAFFESSDRDASGVFKPGDQVAGFALAAVTSAEVVLTNETGRIDLAVGKRLTRSGDAPWALADGAVDNMQLSEPAPAKTEGASDGGESDGGEELDEVMKRLLERRKQELGR